ncbi:hypothetical protein [Streptomyces sp. NPDC002057]|uniref:hypothetical protein n=1 Tax=Streptomyces sp. NPDC002057 TaxID=3154664 RepID=UPI0033197358
MYDPSGPGRLLVGLFTAMAAKERENVRESTFEGLDAAARKRRHGGRPPVITADMVHTVLRLRANGETVENVQLTCVRAAAVRALPRAVEADHHAV